jgi:ABC-type bacteriocin/lantibiotic exporter with double-glycine peptidase domain
MKELKINKQLLISSFKRYHLVLFVVVVVLLLSVAILLLNGIVGKASGDNATPTGGTTSNFDQETIDRIKELKTSNQPSTPLDLSRGRYNPFSE